MRTLATTFRALVAVAGVAAIAHSPASLAQQAYPSAEAAADALVDGVARHDDDLIETVLGRDYRVYVPKGDTSDRTRFLEAWSRGHRIVAQDADRAMLEVGSYGWTLPIPLVKTASGWKFDTKAAPAEMQKRRIGRNELAAIQVALAYADAQDEFYARNPDRAATKHYATKAIASPGRRDGLYWPSLPGEPESPLGPAFADAKPGQAYHGYLYRILNAQGRDAPGGARSYLNSGLMTEGYALVAWPEKYGDSGVMTFIVSRDRVVYQKNLGPDTDRIARSITTFDPGPGWEKVPVP